MLHTHNRYSYNNPLKYTDPDGNFVAVAIGAIVGAYFGGVSANANYNPLKWDYGSVRTYAYMYGGAMVGGVSAFLGGAVHLYPVHLPL